LANTADDGGIAVDPDPSPVSVAVEGGEATIAVVPDGVVGTGVFCAELVGVISVVDAFIIVNPASPPAVPWL